MKTSTCTPKPHTPTTSSVPRLPCASQEQSNVKYPSKELICTTKRSWRERPGLQGKIQIENAQGSPLIKTTIQLLTEHSQNKENKSLSPSPEWGRATGRAETGAGCPGRHTGSAILNLCIEAQANLSPHCFPEQVFHMQVSRLSPPPPG